MMTPLTATDWRAVVRHDGSIFFECGSSDPGKLHMAFDVNLNTDYGDRAVANRFCEAINWYNHLQKKGAMTYDEGTGVIRECRHKMVYDTLTGNIRDIDEHIPHADQQL